MGKINWTEEQREIIDARGADILVSAAAGSGKTTVLVERILERILDKDEPVDVDRFVVVTFTRAAAAQMKERLLGRLQGELEQHPGDTHLQRQISLVPSAHISTVHSFCGYVIQNYFHRIGLDPSYRQGTESELALLRSETVEEILEEEYEEGAGDFIAFARLRIFNRSDEAMAEMIFRLYNQAMSEPFPLEWLEMAEKLLSIQSAKELEKSPFIQALMTDTRRLLRGIEEEKEALLRICEEKDGPYYFEKQLLELSELLEKLLSCQTYSSLRGALEHMNFSMMRAGKDDTVDEGKKKAVADGRNMCRDELRALRDERFAQDIDGQLADLSDMAAPLLTLLRLTKKFMEAYGMAKRERNIVDFNDLEQLALSILYEDDENGCRRRSAAAEELSDYFEEIMIDEYQDSNRVQDALMSALSRDGRPGYAPNMFMVGDVKQSIYRFRNACPELFIEKYLSYSSGPGTQRRIDLHQNFRSRSSVLEGVNAVFDRVMRADIGGVAYDADARLQTGRVFPEAGVRAAGKIDAYVLVDNKDMAGEGRQALECIQDMVNTDNPYFVLGEDGYRPVQYRDIVILIRSVRTMGQPVFETLTAAGIPVVMEHTQGFFETREIGLMAAMLQVLDNPRQDIPLAAVLAGPMFDFTEEELAKIRLNARDKSLFDSLSAFFENAGTDSALWDKISHFMDTLEKLREKISYVTVTELMEDIYSETGIYETVMMMPGGAQRTANMDLLMELAREFDETAYHGLYQFVHYINRIREQKEEMGEVNIVGEGENAVRIMTMHKSKGLEFPVCILMGLGRDLAKKRQSTPLIVHPELGIASPIWDTVKHTKKDNLFCSVLTRLNAKEDLGEELRVLYVAMTRAEEKLILIGSAKEEDLASGHMNYMRRSRMKCYLDMLMPAIISEPGYFQLELIQKENLLDAQVSDIVEERTCAELFNKFDTGVCYHKELHGLLARMESVNEEDTETFPIKVTVSEIKKKSMENPEFPEETLFDEPEEEMPIPSFLAGEKQKERQRGSAYGTIWHQVLASIDFTVAETEGQIRDEVKRLVQEGRLRPEDVSVLHYGKLSRFFQSGLGQEMRKAAVQGKLHREQPFVIHCRACDIFPGQETSQVLVQGIIDGYYETEDGIVLMDYKTDSVREGEEEKLVERYKAQMAFYKKALETILGRPVKACVLYSFSLGKAVSLPEMGETNV